MKATEIVQGDVFRQDGEDVYHVLWAEEPDAKGVVYVGVRYVADGGGGVRYFDANDDVPLIHP